MSILSETPRDAILRLMGLLEKALATRTSRGTFREQLDANRAVFSDVSGISRARSVRNQIAHGELVPEAQARQAKAVLDQALSEVLRPQPRTQSPTKPALHQLPRDTAMAAAAPARARSIPQCTWVYFATDSAEDFAATKRIVTAIGLIVRTVYNSAGIAIANTKQIRVGDTILLVHGGGDRGLPYRPMLSCEVIAPCRPISGFHGFSFLEDRHIPQLASSNYPRDPHFDRYTGISVKPLVDLDNVGTPVTRPGGNNAIRKWNEVFQLLLGNPENRSHRSSPIFRTDCKANSLHLRPLFTLSLFPRHAMTNPACPSARLGSFFRIAPRADRPQNWVCFVILPFSSARKRVPEPLRPPQSGANSAFLSR